MAEVNIKIDIDKIDDNIEKALIKTMEAVRTDILDAQVIPKDTGTLEESLKVDSSESKYGRVAITTDTVYARRLYFHPEYNFQKVNNKNAKGRWFEDWTTGKRRKDIIEYFNKFYGDK